MVQGPWQSSSGQGGKPVHKTDAALFRQGLPDILPVAVIEIEHQLAPVALNAVDNAGELAGIITAGNGCGIDNQIHGDGNVSQILQRPRRTAELTGQTAGFLIVTAGHDDRFGPQPVKNEHHGPC